MPSAEKCGLKAREIFDYVKEKCWLMPRVMKGERIWKLTILILKL